MCKAHSKVTHIKQQKYFHHLKRPYLFLSITEKTFCGGLRSFDFDLYGNQILYGDRI